MVNNIKSVRVYLTEEKDKDLDAYDHTCLSNVNMCPTWGILRYVHHKTLSASSRALALEAGSAAHDGFAALRLFQLHHFDKHPELAEHHGKRIFTPPRWKAICDAGKRATDLRTQAINVTSEALYTGEFYDDPSDRRRTTANLEEMLMAYVDRWDFERFPVWVRDPSDPTSDVGVEVPFDMVVEFTMEDGTILKYRFIGKIDGIHTEIAQDDRVVLHENKTAARMDDAWKNAFHMSHQVTGYLFALALWCKQHVDKAYILGTQLPLPRVISEGMYINRYARESHMFAHWFEWFFHTVQIIHQYKDDILTTPRYSHSCNRYFRSCSFLPICTAPDDEKLEIIEGMEEDRWSPLDD